jgi:hypothetical protein
MPEHTRLTPAEEWAFQQWAQTNGIRDVDHPDSYYDYRGFWKQTQGAAHPPGESLHFPDTFKQHGHPSFSVESQYSAGPHDGGRWLGDSFVPNGADLLMSSRGQQRQPNAMAEALRLLMQHTGK